MDAGLLVAREGELEAIRALLRGDGADARALVLEGDPGVGKTSLWERGVAWAREDGRRVLVARASEDEGGLPFAGLIDLFDAVTSEELGSVPAPQLRALDVALYRADPTDRPPEAQVISLAVLSALRALSEGERILVAVDDLQWLDSASEEAIAYAARRLHAEPVTFLLARRPGRRTAVEKAFPDEQLVRVDVGAISLGATRQILAARLGLRLPHHLLRRVYETTMGNPLFAIEVGRMLAGRDLDTLGDDLPVPDARRGPARPAGRRPRRARAPGAAGPRPGRRPPGRRSCATCSGPAALRRRGRGGRRHRRRASGSGPRTRCSRPRPSARPRGGRAARAAPRGSPRSSPTSNAAPSTSRSPPPSPRRGARAQSRRRGRPGGRARRDPPGGRPGARTPGGSPRRSTSDVDRVLALGRHLHDAGEKQRLTELLAARVDTLPAGAARVHGVHAADRRGGAGQRRHPRSAREGAGRGGRRPHAACAGAAVPGRERGGRRGAAGRARRRPRHRGGRAERARQRRRPGARGPLPHLDPGPARAAGRAPGRAVPRPVDRTRPTWPGTPNAWPGSG